MAQNSTTLGEVCTENFLNPKWLMAPSHRVAHQWIETLVRSGQAAINLRPTTVLRLAMDLVGDRLAADGLSLASRSIGPLIVDAIWGQLPPGGYLSRLERSAELSATVYDSLLSMRLAGISADDVDESCLENAAKAQDLVVLLDSYQGFLAKHSLVDEAGVLRLAVASLNAESSEVSIDPQSRVLVPQGFRTSGLERQFLDTLPASLRIEIKYPAMHDDTDEPAADIRLLGFVARAGDLPDASNNGSVQFFRAVGEINEIREVLRRCLADGTPLDDVEILHTDAETYIPLIHATARRYFDDDRPDGVPVTFAEGIPASLSRPGRALAAWLRWIDEGFPQRLLVEMLGDRLLDCGDDDELSFSYLARLLRPIAIGLGAGNYLPKLNEQIKSLRSSATLADDVADDNYAVAARQRRLKGLKTLRKTIRQLLKFSHDDVTRSDSSVLHATENFLTKSARTVSELDRYAAEALLERIQERQVWLDRLGGAVDLRKWLAALPSQTNVLGSGPQPGHLHVAHVGAGGHSGRKHTFVVGLDDRRFPGLALQDPILLDRERARLNPELATSAVRQRHKIEDLAAMLSRLAGTVTLSWPCHELTDDRETFPSPVVLSAFRLVSGQRDADLPALNAAAGPPVSFAPRSAEQALDESERWLWRLSDNELQGTDQTALVEARFPHLARGSEARRQRAAGFGIFNGWVPQAGPDLNPLVTNGPVLSASTLETAGRCPLAFFFRHALGLYPPSELEIDPDRWLDPAQFGQLLHEVFRCFMAELSSAGKRPQFERDHQRLAKILKNTVQHWRQGVPPPNENAFRMQYWQLVRTTRIFLQAEEAFCKRSRPRYFEVAIGKEAAGGNSIDHPQPVQIALPSGQSIRTRGQIDRVDETDGQFAVWDYKVGSGYGYDPVDPFRDGRRVQSVLYLQMIESLLREEIDPAAIVERFGYFFPSVRAHGLRVDWTGEDLSAGLTIVERLCELMAAGVFLATDTTDDCQYCDFRSICADVKVVTSQSKLLLERSDLVELQPLRELRRRE